MALRTPLIAPFAVATSLVFAADVLAQEAPAPAATAPITIGQPGQSVDITLSTGETIRGTVVSDDGTTLVITHPVLGQLTIPRANQKVIMETPPAAPPPPPPPPPVPGPAPDPESFWEGWSHSIELGASGSSGNTEKAAVRTALTLRRETSKEVSLLNFLYLYGSSNGDADTNRAELNLRQDWKIGSPWRMYATGQVQYDDFQDWNWRVSAFGGFGYELIFNDTTLLLPRLGIGASQEYGGDDDRIKPSLNIGLDFTHKFDDRQSIFFTFDYYPSLLNFPSDYYIQANAGYQILVDPKNNLSLRIGVEERYQSEPGPGKENSDLSGFVTFIYGW